MIHLAQQSGKILGLASHLVDSGRAVLQYADDTILFIQDDVTSAINLKLVLYLFEAMSGLKINFEKSEVLLVQPDEEKLIFYADLFKCQTGTWPIKYLGTPVSHRRTTVAEMKFVGERIRKGTEGWIGGALSIGGRVTKIDACLSNSAIYQMSLRILHKTNLEELEKPIRAFFWDSSRNKKKVYWVSRKRICKPKCKGGLGIKNLTKFNISLMCKWWWKLEEGVVPWQDFMWKKYLRNSGIYTAVQKT
jgi:hypothetical protein